MSRILLIFFSLILSITSFGQIADSLEYNEEMGLKDRFGFFHDKNAIKYTPAYSAFGDDDKFLGHSFSFEFGNIGKKLSLNYTVRYFEGFEDLSFGFDPSNPNYDSVVYINKVPRNIRFEIMPRLYYLEDVGIYVASYFAIAQNLETQDYKPIFGITTGYSSILFNHFLIDMSLSIQYDTLAEGVIGDIPVELRPYLGIGYVYKIKSPYSKY